MKAPYGGDRQGVFTRTDVSTSDGLGKMSKKAGRPNYEFSRADDESASARSHLAFIAGCDQMHMEFDCLRQSASGFHKY